MGIEMEKQWVATLDGRTRHDHALADGQTVAEDKPFAVGGYELMYPGDPSGPGHEIYNCRCTMIARVKGVDMSDAKRRDRYGVLPDMTYAQWENTKRGKAAGFGEKPKPVLERLNFAQGTAEVDRLSVEQEVSQIPQRARELAEPYISQIVITDGDRSGYRPATGELFLNRDREPGTVAHEYAHALEKALNIYEDPEFLKIRAKGFENLRVTDIIIDGESFIATIKNINNNPRGQTSDAHRLE